MIVEIGVETPEGRGHLLSKSVKTLEEAVGAVLEEV
jgi:hypothetical protein